ncbi:MAG: helicase [Labilithrix sp.]|nr:helicase [Labilithrix sp.]MCW5816941.1 helicase [Labilithrix sp.]
MTAGITALLGPTNTGKTHHAIERMLEHPTGMIGLPLRLLAREVYDKVTARVGESRVALVTGEEQRVPRRPSYWIATTEAMPVHRDVDFLAVDEVQLAAHAQRGHVFTSRLLSARGTQETWFLGAATMRGVLRELTPAAKQVEHPRLSSLRFAGATPLARLPPRSAVVAFSTPHVYELADRLRKRRGGAAIVLGALSPRTRNAQVAMFQAGEVDCLVATDAIGMGLNLGVEHVAFAATRKFDGKDVRDLDEAELGQIAGRAGRWIHDGTFGTVTPLGLPDGVTHAIETHGFAPVRRVQWRSDDLDFSSVAALRASLAEPPARPILRHASAAEDARLLALLADRDAVRARARGDGVRLLWDVCTVPDFRKLMLEVHADFLESLFVELADRGRLRDEWIERQVRELERPAGDVEELVARIASVRVWTYVANRATWLDAAEAWEARTRQLEDRLSDALHERLVARFVDAKKKHAPPRSPQRASSRSSVDDVYLTPAPDPSHPFAKLAALRSSVAAGASDRPSLPGSPAWVEDVIAAAHANLALQADGQIMHSATNRAVGRVARGSSIAVPAVRLATEDLGAGAKSRLQRRLLAFTRDLVAELLGGVGDLATKSAPAPLRGFVHRLEQGLGTALEPDVADVLAMLDAESRASLEAAGVVFARGVVYVASGLAPAAVAARVALAAAWFGAGKGLVPPSGGAVSFAPSRGFERAAYVAIGFPVVGPRAIRADVVARLVAAEALEEAEAATWIGASRGDTRKVLAGLGLAQGS